MTPEVWRAVEGWPYEVSNQGRVRRTTTAKNTVAGRVLKSQRTSGAHYAKVNLCDEGRNQYFSVHRLVACAFLGAPPSSRHQVAHNDGNGQNNRVENLRWATAVENQHDKRLHGTHCQGETVGNSKLTEAAVRHIRSCVTPNKVLARHYGVTLQLVWLVRKGLMWKHVA